MLVFRILCGLRREEREEGRVKREEGKESRGEGEEVCPPPDNEASLVPVHFPTLTASLSAFQSGYVALLVSSAPTHRESCDSHVTVM